MTDTPKPGIPLIVCAVLVIAFCLFFISSWIGLVTFHLEFGTLLSGICFLPFTAIIAVLQYFAVFRRNARAAKSMGIIFYVLAGVTLYGIALNIVGAALKNLAESIPSIIGFGVIGLLFLAGYVIAGWLHLEYSRQLFANATDVVASNADFRFTTRELLVGVTVIALMIGLVSFFIRSAPPMYGEHVTAKDAQLSLPAGASDVCFYRRSLSCYWCEFTIGEPEFREWVTSRHSYDNAPILPITTPVTVSRYTGMTHDHVGPESVDVTNGFIRELRHPNGGGYQAVFDSDSQRAYYSVSPN